MNKYAKNLAGRPRSAEADRAILQAALELLAEVGYQAMSIEAIAARAGVGKATIYRRYSSANSSIKEELVADAIESQFGEEEEAIPDTGSLWADLEFVISDIIQTTLTDLGRQTIALIVSTASSSPQFAQIYYTKYIATHRDELAVVFDRAKTRGEIEHTVDAGFFTDLIASSILYAMMFKSKPETIEAHIRRVMHLAVTGSDIGAKPGSKSEP